MFYIYCIYVIERISLPAGNLCVCMSVSMCVKTMSSLVVGSFRPNRFDILRTHRFKHQTQ